MAAVHGMPDVGRQGRDGRTVIYPAPLLAEKLDGEALDEMLRLLDKKGRVVPLKEGGPNPWYRYQNWEDEYIRAHLPPPLPKSPPPPEHETRDEERTRALREHAIEIYCRQFADLDELWERRENDDGDR